MIYSLHAPKTKNYGEDNWLRYGDEKEFITALKDVIKRAAELLTGVKRRRYEAEITQKFLGGSHRRAEREFGWSRATVRTGLGELKTGIVCKDSYNARGNRCTEDQQPQLKVDILDLVEPTSQTDPSFKTTFRYTRITAKGLRIALIEKKAGVTKTCPVLARWAICLIVWVTAYDGYKKPSH